MAGSSVQLVVTHQLGRSKWVPQAGPSLPSSHARCCNLLRYHLLRASLWSYVWWDTSLLSPVCSVSWPHLLPKDSGSLSCWQGRLCRGWPVPGKGDTLPRPQRDFCLGGPGDPSPASLVRCLHRACGFSLASRVFGRGVGGPQ